MQAFGKFTLRPIECHESPLIACPGLYVLTLWQTLGGHRNALELHLRTAKIMQVDGDS
jgi:hypothetical protein